MIWGYHYFWKHPYDLVSTLPVEGNQSSICDITCSHLTLALDAEGEHPNISFPPKQAKHTSQHFLQNQTQISSTTKKQVVPTLPSKPSNQPTPNPNNPFFQPSNPPHVSQNSLPSPRGHKQSKHGGLDPLRWTCF